MFKRVIYRMGYRPGAADPSKRGVGEVRLLAEAQQATKAWNPGHMAWCYSILCNPACRILLKHVQTVSEPLFCDRPESNAAAPATSCERNHGPCADGKV